MLSARLLMGGLILVVGLFASIAGVQAQSFQSQAPFALLLDSIPARFFMKGRR